MKSRIRKKLIKSSIIAIDLMTIPDRLDSEQWLKLVREHGVIIWDSYKVNNRPQIFPKKNTKVFIFKDKNNESK